MSDTSPDDSSRPEPNPYQPPRDRSGSLRRVGSVAGYGLAAVGIVLASLIAFVVTCVPAGLALGNAPGPLGSNALPLAIAAGVAVAGLVAYGLGRAFWGGGGR